MLNVKTDLTKKKEAFIFLFIATWNILFFNTCVFMCIFRKALYIYNDMH